MFSQSKFVSRCAPEKVCATVKDPDNDPLEWNWSVIDGPAHAGPNVSSTTTNPDGSVTQCVQFEGQEAGKLDVTLTVYDLVAPNGTPERVEQWLADQGYPGSSHASLTFPIYIADAGRTPSPEICDGIDNDCNLQVDEGGVCKGPDPQCAGQTCGTFTRCNEGGSCSTSGVCGSTAEGGGLCVNGNTPCGGLADCSNGSGDCNPGDICLVSSCCGRPVCVPQAQFCSSPSAAPGAPVQLQTSASETMSHDAGPTLGAP